MVKIIKKASDTKFCGQAEDEGWYIERAYHWASRVGRGAPLSHHWVPGCHQSLDGLLVGWEAPVERSVALYCKLWRKEEIWLQKFPETSENLSRVIYYNLSFIISSCWGGSVCRFLLTSVSRKRAQCVTSLCAFLCPDPDYISSGQTQTQEGSNLSPPYWVLMRC
jgi:hypothetical protein